MVELRVTREIEARDSALAEAGITPVNGAAADAAYTLLVAARIAARGGFSVGKAVEIATA